MKMANILFKLSSSEDLCLEKLGSVCRICLQTYMPLFSIFHDHIDEMISEFVPDKVDKQDNFPHQICKKCLEDVKVAYSLKKQIEYSHEIIKNLLCGKRLSRSSKKKVYDELLSPSISSQNSNNKTYFQCHICKRRLKRRDILKIHLEKIHKCFELQYNDKFDSGKEKVGNISSENESDNEPLISLLKDITSDIERKVPINDNHDLGQQYTVERIYCNLCEMYYSRTYFIRHKREVHGGFEPGGKSSLLNKTKIEEPQKQFVESNPKTNDKHYNNLQGLDGERKRRKSASYNMYAPKY